MISGPPLAVGLALRTNSGTCGDGMLSATDTTNQRGNALLNYSVSLLRKRHIAPWLRDVRTRPTPNKLVNRQECSAHEADHA